MSLDARTCMKACTRQSQAQITGVIKPLEMGLIAEPVSWKLDSGWADLSAAQINAAAAAAHVQACFVAEWAVSQRIEAAADPASVDIAAAFDAAYGAAITTRSIGSQEVLRRPLKRGQTATIRHAARGMYFIGGCAPFFCAANSGRRGHRRPPAG